MTANTQQTDHISSSHSNLNPMTMMRLFQPSIPAILHRAVATLLLLLCTKTTTTHAGKPAPAHYFPQQLVDHLDDGSGPYKGQKWSQRFYVWKDYFQGPGHPIFLIFGGEGAIKPSAGILYPVVSDHLARHFGAFVLQPEHRFYGFSQPLTQKEEDDGLTSSLRKRRLQDSEEEDPRVRLFTSEQALMDAAVLVKHIQETLHCSHDKTSPDYCPVISVGGSYPGFLSAMSRLRLPDVFDMSYAASAPMKFYSQEVDQADYYNHISKVAEKTLAGCAQAVKDALTSVAQQYDDSNYIPALEVGICPGTLPDYASVDREVFLQELFMMVGYSFANDNMANYPPTPKTRLYQSCQIFLKEEVKATDKVKEFLVDRLSFWTNNTDCFDMTQQLPTGPHATITGGDWSGDGTGTNGESWDFQTCTLLVEKIGFSEQSMFPPRNWTLDWMTQHCQARFGVTPRPTELVSKWRFDDLVGANATRILFTNGLNDGWSVGGIQQNLSESLLALNFENGAHHSDLNGVGPVDTDTEDIKKGYGTVQTILEQWLKEVKQGVQTTESATA